MALKFSMKKENNWVPYGTQFFIAIEQIAVQGIAYTIICDISLLAGRQPLISVMVMTIYSLFGTTICRGRDDVIRMLAVPIQAIPVDSEQYIRVFLAPGSMADCNSAIAIVRPRIFYGCTRYRVR